MPRSENLKKTCLKDVIKHYADSTPLGSLSTTESLEKKIAKIPQSWLESQDVESIYCERIKLARLGKIPEGKKLSQSVIAEKLGISTEAYSKKERETKPIDRTDLVILCIFYRISPEYLLGLTDDPHETYILRTARGAWIGEDSNENKAEHLKRVSLPMQIDSNQVWNRCQTILFHLYNDPELCSLLLQLAEMKLPVQKSVLLNLKDLPSLRECPVDSQLKIIRQDSFQLVWTEFILFKSDAVRDRLREYIQVLKHLGQSNFDCLDFMTRVALAPRGTQRAVKLFLNEVLNT